MAKQKARFVVRGLSGALGGDFCNPLYVVPGSKTGPCLQGPTGGAERSYVIVPSLRAHSRSNMVWLLIGCKIMVGRRFIAREPKGATLAVWREPLQVPPTSQPGTSATGGQPIKALAVHFTCLCHIHAHWLSVSCKSQPTQPVPAGVPAFFTTKRR